MFYYVLQTTVDNFIKIMLSNETHARLHYKMYTDNHENIHQIKFDVKNKKKTDMNIHECQQKEVALWRLAT